MITRSGFARAGRELRTWFPVVLLALTLARDAAAQFPGVFNALFSAIENDIGGSLGTINRITGETSGLLTGTIAPPAAINQARGFVVNSISRLRGALGETFNTSVASAVTPGPAEFESILMSRQSAQIPSLQASFLANYGAVPAVNQASVQDRLMVDVDDALGEESLKTTLIADQGAELVLAAADRMEDQVAVSAPGSSPLLTAQAEVANLRCQAYIQKMLAAQLREEAGRIAHDNALIKRRAQAAGGINNVIHGALTVR